MGAFLFGHLELLRNVMEKFVARISRGSLCGGLLTAALFATDRIGGGRHMYPGCWFGPTCVRPCVRPCTAYVSHIPQSRLGITPKLCFECIESMVEQRAFLLHRCRPVCLCMTTIQCGTITDAHASTPCKPKIRSQIAERYVLLLGPLDSWTSQSSGDVSCGGFQA